MKIKSIPLGITLLVILFGGIVLTSALGLWQTESDKKPAKFTTGEYAGEYNPADIRGSFGFSDISMHFDIPIEVLADAFMLPDDMDPSLFLNKDLEVLYEGLVDEETEIGNASVQLFVALYTGLPYEITEDIYLPARAVRILIQKGGLTDEQMAYLDAHTVYLGVVPSILLDESDVTEVQDGEAEPVLDHTPLSDQPGAGTGELTEEHDEDAAIVKGNTTFYNVLSWGVSEEEIVKIIGGEMPPTAMLVKAYCTEQGLEFGTIKTALQAAVDAAQAGD